MTALEWFVDAKTAAFMSLVNCQPVEESYLARLASCFKLLHTLVAHFLLARCKHADRRVALQNLQHNMNRSYSLTM